MSVVHYKFRSSLEYDSVTFDGLSISLGDLKEAISSQKKMGKNSSSMDFILQVTNAQTKEEYADESAQIPKNSSVIVRRIPLANAQPKNKTQLGAEKADMYTSGLPKPVEMMKDHTLSGTLSSSSFGRGASVASSVGSEEDKIKAMISQVGEEWNPSKYTYGRGRGFVPTGPLPASYICYRCGQPGHYIRNCPTNVGKDAKFEPRIKRSTGIPKTWIGEEFVRVDDNKVHSSEHLPTVRVVKTVPEELKCPMCKKLLTDAVLIPCCGTSYCDDCIRNYLLDNEQVCPECGMEGASPDNLVVNKQLRQAVKSFNTNSTVIAQPASSVSQSISSSVTVSTTTKAIPTGLDTSKQEVVKSEADSTKNNETTMTKESAVGEAEKTSTNVPTTSSTSVSVPSTTPSQSINSTVGVPKPNVPSAQHVRGDQAQLHPKEGNIIEVPPHQIRSRMPIMPGMTVSSYPGQPLPRPHVPIRDVAMSIYAPTSVSRPVVRSMPMEFLPAHLKPMQPIRPIRPVSSFPLAHLPPRSHGYNSPVQDIPGYRPPPPLSEEEFYRTQRRLKVSKPSEKKRKITKKKPEREPHLPTLRHGDFDDELSQYKALQKVRRKERSRTPSWSSDSSRSRSPDRKSGSFSSFGPSRSPTPEGWDRSRSPTPSPELIKQKHLTKNTRRNKDKSPKRTKRVGDTDQDVQSKKRRKEKIGTASRSSKIAHTMDESKNVNKGSSDESKIRKKETSSSGKREGNVSSSKKRVKEHISNKGELKRPKTESSKVNNNETTSEDKGKNISDTKPKAVEIKTKDSSKRKIKKKRKRKEKREKRIKVGGETQETESEITTQDDDDDFDIVQDKETIVDVKESKDSQTDLLENNEIINKKGSDTRTPPEIEIMESVEQKSIQYDEDDFDIVQDKETIDATRLLEDKNVVGNDNEKQEQEKKEKFTEIEKVTVDENEDDDFELVYGEETIDRNDKEELNKTGLPEESKQTRTDNVSETVNIDKHMDVSRGSKISLKEENHTKSQDIEEELVLNTSDSLETSTENIDLNIDINIDKHEEDEHKDMELEISVLVGKEGRRDSLLDELQSDEENATGKDDSVKKTEEGLSDTKHKKHKKKDKKHKHKKHKKKHKHKKSKKHKKEKNEEATSAPESQATQSDSFDDEEEELDFSEDSEMEEVFKGPRSVVVQASTVQSD